MRRAALFLALLLLPSTSEAQPRTYVPMAPATARFFDWSAGVGSPKLWTSYRMDLNAVPSLPTCALSFPASPAAIAGGLAGLDRFPASANPYAAGTANRTQWEAARANCELHSLRWGRRSPDLGGADSAKGFDCPANEKRFESVNALTAWLGRAPTWIEERDFVHTCSTDPIGKQIMAEAGIGGGDTGGGDGGEVTTCTVRHWIGPPLPWKQEDCGKWYDGTTYTERGCCGQALQSGPPRCVAHPACWPEVKPPPPPPPLCPNGQVDPGEDCITCPADMPAGACEVEPPPPPPPTGCEKLWLAVEKVCPR